MHGNIPKMFDIFLSSIIWIALKILTQVHTQVCLTYRQCDQMVRLFFKLLAIYNNRSLPKKVGFRFWKN